MEGTCSSKQASVLGWLAVWPEVLFYSVMLQILLWVCVYSVRYMYNVCVLHVPCSKPSLCPFSHGSCMYMYMYMYILQTVMSHATLDHKWQTRHSHVHVCIKTLASLTWKGFRKAVVAMLVSCPLDSQWVYLYVYMCSVVGKEFGRSLYGDRGQNEWCRWS